MEVLNSEIEKITTEIYEARIEYDRVDANDVKGQVEVLSLISFLNIKITTLTNLKIKMEGK